MERTFEYLMSIWNSEKKLLRMRRNMPCCKAGETLKALCTLRLRVLYAIRRDRNVNPY